MSARIPRVVLAALAALSLVSAACLDASDGDLTLDPGALTSSLDDAEPGADTLAACGDKDCEAVDKRLTRCGLICPADHHPIAYSRNFQCGSGINDNQVTCDPNTGNNFGSCGLSCPGGYHPTAYSRNFQCGSGINDNQVSCFANTGAQFNSCGLSCPSGYVAVAYSRNFQCGSGINDNQVTCDRILRGDVWASPSSIVLAPGQTGSTTVGWTSSSASWVEVRAVAPGQGERVIASGAAGSVGYGPIAAGETHTLHLYGSGVLLDTATVSAVAQTATITATPQNPVVGANGLASTTIAWSTRNVGNGARVTVSVDGGAPTVFAGDASGASVAPWIQANHSYRFAVRASATGPELAAVVVTAQGQAPAIDPVSGSWYNPARSGNGFDIRVVGNQMLAAWMTYTAAGVPVWYMSVLERQPGRWSGSLQYTTWNGSSATVTIVGSLTITLDTATRGQVAWTLNGASGSEPIQYLAFGSGAPIANLAGSWYLPSESGWGVGFDTQGTTHVVYLMVYSATGAPTWVMGVGTGSGTVSFGLTRTTGTNLCPGCTGPTSTTTTAAGTMTVTTNRVGSGQATATIDAALAGGSWQRNAIELVRLFGP
jgi:hypothetical protein